MYMEGCEECNDEYHIVGVFSIEKKAEEAKNLHKKYRHLHDNNIDIDPVVLDDYQKSYCEGEESHTLSRFKCKQCGFDTKYIYWVNKICYKCKIKMEEVK